MRWRAAVSCSPLTVIWRMLAGSRAAPVAGAGTWRATPPQTPRPAVPSRARARPALQLLLRRRRLPFAGDAAVAALPRAQGVCRDHRRADHHSAARRQRRAARALEPGRVRRPAHDRTLAQVVA